MMLCCAAFISSGSARFIAVTAALRSPVLIASSTERTAVRSLVRRALLTTVRRAILRVAFLAEVVLAISSNILRQVPIAAGRARLSPRHSNLAIDADMLFRCSVRRMPGPEQIVLAGRAAPLKEQRRRDCARRHWPVL